MSVQAVVLSASIPTSKPAQQETGAPDYQSFLKLLVEQMKSQDPTNPTSSTEMLSQLASFSAVEQQTATNAKLAAISESLAILQSSTLVGMRATTADRQVSEKIQAVYWQDGTPIAVLADGRNLTITSDLTLSI
jgi:flagellar basal-body rod modification protein FlgD